MGLKQKLCGAKRRLWRQRWSRWIIKLAIVVIIFCLGQAVGDGRLNLTLHQPSSVTNNLPATLNYSSVNQIYQSLKENYNGKLTETELLNGLKHGLAQSMNDPYTEYFTPAEATQFNNQLNNAFSGIGAELSQDSAGDIQVIAPIDGAPAAKAGLKAQDIIVTINGTSTQGMSVDQAVSKIRGKAGSKVTLGVIRNQTQALTIVITRQNITVPSVKTKILPGNIGYMSISTFADDTSSLAQKAADQFKQAGVKGIILDLRDNPGGLVTAAINVSSLWVPEGKTVVETKGTTGDQTQTALGDDELNGIPTVILIDAGSASASEITTGALHDNNEAYVIGTKSYGKGVEQSLINFGDGSQLKVTVASWYRPNGQNINHKGITPDQTIKEPTDATALGTTDTQFQAALTYLTAH